MTIREAERVLGLPAGQAQISAATTNEEELQILREIKKDARRAYRRRAKHLHPDVQGSHEAMIELTEARDKILAARLQPRQQPIASVVRVWTGATGGVFTVDMTRTRTGTDASSTW